MASIALVTIALNNMAGGLERNIIALANKLAHDGHTVRLLTFDWPDATAFFDIDPRVAWYQLGETEPHTGVTAKQRLRLIARMYFALRVYPEVTHIVCFHHGLLARCVASRGFLRAKIVCSERNSLTLYDHIQSTKYNINFGLLVAADKITVQFKSYAEDYPSWLQKKIVEVPNPIKSIESKQYNKMERKKIILSVGRLNKQKQFDLLIDAFNEVRKEFLEWRLVIVGSGPLRRQLEEQIKDLNLQQFVEICAPTSDLMPFYAQATLYCQPSQWEGFPNAMAEAMAAGVIPVGLSKTRGVADLIKAVVDDPDWYFLAKGAQDIDALHQTLVRAIEAEPNWTELSQKYRSIKKIYSETRWALSWETALGLTKASALLPS